MSEGQFALGGLAALAIWTLVALPLLHQETDAITIFNGLLVLVTGGLIWVGLRQADLTKQIADRQVHDTEILQRAYISVEPLGIEPFVGPKNEIVGQIGFRNHGRLPARNVSNDVYITYGGGKRKYFPLGDVPSSTLVIAPGGMAPRGSPGADPAKITTRTYIFIWGVVRYHDGFNPNRTTKFCHRYPCARVGPDGKTIHRRHARYHEHGNDAD
jgi:hypothetical protein